MTGWLIETLIATTLLMLGVLAIREPVSRHFGPRIAYLLWIIPALRMVMPPLPEGWLAPELARVQEVAVILTGAATPAAEAPVNWALAMAILWSAGALGFFAWHGLAYLRFTRSIRAGARLLFFRDAIPVTSSRDISSPMAFGLIGKTVVVPDDFSERYDDLEQHFAIEHEVTHHRRGDLAINLFAMGMLAIHWFNPVAHMAWRAFRLDQEAACDALVLDGATADERHAYGSALFKSAAGPVPLAACTISAPATLKKRLRRILLAGSAGERIRSGAMFTGALVVAGLAMTASGGIASEAARQVEKRAPILVLNGGMIDVDIADTRKIEREADAEAQRIQKRIAKADRGRNAAAAAPAIPAEPGEPADAWAPPAPPAPLAAPEAPEALSATSSRHSVMLRVASFTPVDANKIKCAKGTPARIITQERREDDGPVQRSSIVICGHGGSGPDAATIKASLAAARAKIIDDEHAKGAAREAVLAAIDRELARIEALSAKFQ